MPTFNYLSGNPANLTPSGPGNMSDIQGPLTDLRSAINGSLDEVNVPNLSAAFTTWKQIQRFNAINLGSGVGTYVMYPGYATATYGDAPFNNASTAEVSLCAFYLDPTDFNANTRTTKLRVRAIAVPNAVAPAITFSVGLYPIATYTGPSSNRAVVATLSTVVSGSQAAIASPGTLAATKVDSADFNFPAAGMYAMGLVPSGTPAAGSITSFLAFLEMRQV